MKNYFESKMKYNEVSFQLTDKATPDEREIHTYHEILYFIDGEAELFTESSRLLLKKHSLLIIPKKTYHFIRPQSAGFLRLKISIPQSAEAALPLSELMAGFRVIDRPTEGMGFVLGRLMRILEERAGEKSPFYAYAAFLMLIEEMDARAEEARGECAERSGAVAAVIRHISQNLGADLSISALSAAVNISPSGLIHSFKSELGISLHNYITQRRLIYAREQILSGQKPSKIYPDCGYAEYSSFYRAYLKFFGHSPSDEKGGRES